jgi:hypothetical protein
MKTIQRNKILSLLQSKPEVSLPEILSLGIAQYNARIHELRGQGYEITNRTRVEGGIKKSWYRLDKSPVVV